MAATNIPAGSGLAPKQYSEALFSMASKVPTPVGALSGPAPNFAKTEKVLRGQSTSDMPIVRVTDLNQSAGDTVRVDCAQIVKMRPVMGDQNAEGRGAKLDFSFFDQAIDMATIPVSAGGRMTQKRFQHDLRKVAIAQLKRAIPAFLWQRSLTQMCGGRGQQDGVDWVLPLATDPDFASFLVAPLKAPTYNRHYVIDGTDLVQGGAQLGSVDATDKLKLSHIDGLSALISELAVQLQPVMIPGDPAAGDDPIKGILMLDEMVWNDLITDTTSGNNIRTWQASAMERAKYGDLQRHPLFAGNPILWNGILIRKMGRYAIRWNADGTQSPAHIKVANRYSATESTDVAIPNLTAAGKNYSVARSVLLGAQALAMCSGSNTSSGVPYSLLENQTNFGRNAEMAGELICSEQKVRFSLPDGAGNLEPTDIGAIVIDSVTQRLSA